MHRIALFDAAGTIDAVISQMDVLKYMHAHYATAAWAQQSLQDAGALPSRARAARNGASEHAKGHVYSVE